MILLHIAPMGHQISHFHFSLILLNLLAAAAAYLIILNRTQVTQLQQQNTTIVDCLFSRNDFNCSVIHTWGTDKSKAVIGGVTIL